MVHRNHVINELAVRLNLNVKYKSSHQMNLLIHFKFSEKVHSQDRLGEYIINLLESKLK